MDVGVSIFCGDEDPRGSVGDRSFGFGSVGFILTTGTTGGLELALICMVVLLGVVEIELIGLLEVLGREFGHRLMRRVDRSRVG